MANENFFKVNGAKELSEELSALSRTMKSKIITPGLRQGAAVIRKAARQLAPTGTGLLKSKIVSKVYRKKKGTKGVVARIGILGDAGYSAQKKPRPVALYGYKQNQEHTKYSHFLEDALTVASEPAIYKLIEVTQQKMNDFHKKNRRYNW